MASGEQADIMLKYIFIVRFFDFIYATEQNVNAFSYFKTAYTLLNDNNKMPVIGYGTWLGSYRTGETHKNITKLGPEVELGVETAIELGYRMIETSPVYNSEQIVGRVMAKKIREGVIKREDIFLVTKLDRYHCRKENVSDAIRSSLKRLNTRYIDLFIIQFPFGLDHNGNIINYNREGVWKMLVEAKYRKYVRSIGVSNFDKAMISELLNSGFKPAVVEIETNIGIQQPEMQAFCQLHNITIMGYAPLGHIYRRIPGNELKWEDRQLKSLAQDLFRTEAQLALRYLFELDIVPIVRTVLKTEMEEFAHIFDFELSEHEMDLLKLMDKGEYTFKFTFLDPKKNPHLARRKIVL